MRPRLRAASLTAIFETILVLTVTAFLLAYLLVALLRTEKFSPRFVPLLANTQSSANLAFWVNREFVSWS